MKFRVYLATTEGLIQVQRITRELAAQSQICLNRTNQTSPISANYDSFVRRPSGVIEREFGVEEGGAFRLDVSGNIGDGNSWQLGVFIAHALAHRNMLAEFDDTPDAVICLTGHVNYDLELENVAHVPVKLKVACATFSRFLSDGLPVTVFLPRGNYSEIESITFPQGVKIAAVGTTDDVCELLGLSYKNTGYQQNDPRTLGESQLTKRYPRENSKKTPAWLVFGILGILVVSMAAIVIAHQKSSLIPTAWQTDPVINGADVGKTAAGQKAINPQSVEVQEELNGRNEDQKGNLEILVFERRAPLGESCAGVQFGSVKAVTVEIEHESETSLEPVKISGLCGLEFVVTLTEFANYVSALVYDPTGRLLKASRFPETLLGATSFIGRRVWMVDLPRKLTAPLIYKLIVIISDNPIEGQARWFANQPDWEAAVLKLQSQDIFVLIITHKIILN